MKQQLWALALALFFGFLLQAPHLFTGHAHTNLDWRVHYNYALEYSASMAASNFWPRWAFMSQFGVGEPGLLYYAPLYYLIVGGLTQVIGNVWLSMQLVEILSAGLVGWFVYSLARAHAPHRWALLAVPLAIFAPMLCLLHLGFNGYPWASAIAPLSMLIWAVLRPEAEGKWANLPASIALTLTIVTHTVTGLIGVFALAALPIVGLIKARKGFLKEPVFWSPLFILIPGLLLSAVYLVPAFLSQGLINADVWRVNYTPFNAFSLSTVSAYVFGFRWFAFQWPIPLVALGLGALSLYILRPAFAEPRSRHFLMSATAMFACIAFLSTELSYPLWLVNSPLRNIQFPHRFISVLIPLSAVLVAIAMAYGGKRPPRILLGLGAVVSIGMGLAVIGQQMLNPGKPFDTKEARFLPYEGLDEYRTAQSLALGQSAKGFDFTVHCKVQTVVCSEGKRTADGMVWSIAAPTQTTLMLPVYCFPAWTVWIGGSPIAHSCDAKTGLVRLAIPAGQTNVTLAWQSLPNERRGALLSLVGLLMVGGMALASRRMRIA